MNISSKMVFFFLISAIIPIIVISSVSFYLAQASLEKQNFIAVNEEADLETDRIEDFFIERRNDITIISKFELLKHEISTLNQFYTNQTNSQYIESDKKVDEQLEIIRDLYRYDDILILNPNGTIVFVLKDEVKSLFLGKSFLDIDPAAFLEGKNGVYLSHVIPDIDNDEKPEMFLSAPFLDDQGNLLGILVFDIPVQRFLDELFQQTYVGETNETLVVTKSDEKIIVLNNLRFPINTEMTMDEIMKRVQGPAYKVTSNFTGTDYDIDYREQKVIAAWRYIPSLEWGLVSKIDTAEVFEATNQLQQNILVLTIMMMVGVGFFGVVASQTISKPLIKLKDLAMKISQGDLNVQVPVQGTDEISNLSESFNKMVNSLKENEITIKDYVKQLKLTDKQKEEFSSMITHELKTPLSTIIGYSDMLKNPKMGELNKEQQFAINEILSSSISLENLIENILTVKKLELSELSFNIEKISVRELIELVYNRLSPMMSEKQIEFLTSAEEDLAINTDKERIIEVFTNLVQNSVDFVPDSGGRIEITSSSENSNVLFSVIDNGLGIPKEKLGNLFTKYYQVDTSMTRKHGGSGLGLAICRGLVEGLGGKIWIESEEGKGTIIYFTIPKA